LKDLENHVGGDGSWEWPGVPQGRGQEITAGSYWDTPGLPCLVEMTLLPLSLAAACGQGALVSSSVEQARGGDLLLALVSRVLRGA
jgi:hypothetical protein